MSNKITIEQIVQAIDAMNPGKFGEILTDDSVIVSGNAPAVTGKAAIAKWQADFFATLKEMKHEIIRTWENEDSLAAEMIVTYTKLDGKVVSLPVTDIFTLKENKVSGTFIYMDIGPLFA